MCVTPCRPNGDLVAQRRPPVGENLNREGKTWGPANENLERQLVEQAGKGE